METCPSGVLQVLVFVAEAAIGLWIWSVWSWRLKMETSFRAVGAANLVQEFQSYGYPIWVFKFVGAVKCSCASFLVLSIIYPVKIMTLVGASGMAILMTVAVISHAKVKDPPTKYGAATVMLACAVYILCALSQGCVLDQPPFTETADIARACCGVAVALACFGMWLKSFMRGDYNIDSYEKLSDGSTALLPA